MAKTIIVENSFDGSPGGSGNLSNGGSFGTSAGGNTTQDPSKFSSSDKTTNHMASNTESTSSAMMQPTDRPGVGKNVIGKNEYTPIKVSKSNTVSPDTTYDVQKSQKPLDPEKQLDPQVDQLFKNKKYTPTPDDIMSALQYELSNMVKKDKMIAKQTVLTNLKDNPQFYRNLDMLNIDDKKMKIPETVNEDTFSKTKAVLDEMVANKKKAVCIADTPELNQIFKDLSDRRFRKNS